MQPVVCGTLSSNVISPRPPWSQTQTEIDGETAQPDVHIQMWRADAPTECRLSRVQMLQWRLRSKPAGQCWWLEGVWRVSANNPGSIYVWFPSFSTENTRSFGRNRNSCHSILPKLKTGRNCVFHRFRCRNRNRISVGLSKALRHSSVLENAALLTSHWPHFTASILFDYFLLIMCFRII